MSNALRDAAEVSIHTLKDAAGSSVHILKDAAGASAHTLSDLAHEVSDRIDDLPMPNRPARGSRIWWAIPIIGAVILLKMWSKRHRRTAIDAAADRARKDVDVDEVAKHYKESTSLGANAKGEGQIAPLHAV